MSAGEGTGSSTSVVVDSVVVSVGRRATVGVSVVRTVDVISVVDVVDMDIPGTAEVTEMVCKVIVIVVAGVKSPRAGVEVLPMLMVSSDRKSILFLRRVSS